MLYQITLKFASGHGCITGGLEMVEKPPVHVLLTFDFEEWEGRYRTYEADLYGKTRRVVELLEEREVPATFFLDAETVLKYPEAAGLIVEEGFELALHSDYHFGVNNSSLSTLDFSRQDSETQMARMKNAVAMIRQVIPSFNPRGFRAPGLRWNEDLYVSLRKLGFLYDSSQEDKFVFQPFLKNGVVVFPMNCGDYDSACYKIGVRYVVAAWMDNFNRAREAARKTGESYFLLLAHPSVSGKHKYIGMLKSIINHMNRSEKEYLTCTELAEHVLRMRKGTSHGIKRRMKKPVGVFDKRSANLKELRAGVLQLKKGFEEYRAKVQRDVEAIKVGAKKRERNPNVT